jgi:hypothetical protein
MNELNPENAPVIHIAGRNFRPEDDARQHDFYDKWLYEAYIPTVSQSIPGLLSVDRYHIVKENPKYPQYIMTYSFDNLKSFQNYNNHVETAAMRHVIDANFPETDYTWFVQYQLTKSWRK